MGQVCKCETETYAERGFGLGAVPGGAEDLEDLAWPARPATAAPRGVPPMLAEATDAVEDWAAEALPGTSDPEGSRPPLVLAAPAAETGTQERAPEA